MQTKTIGIAFTLAVACLGGWVLLGMPGLGSKPIATPANLPWPAPVEKDASQFPPALSPAEAAKTIHMAPGYHLELVASEPLVKDPILAEYDGDGRLWVMEMPGYAVGGDKMLDSREPINDIVILEDTNHDGVYDKRTVFMDHLVLPRAFKILDKNCALVGEPPHLWKACDTNGDLKSDAKEQISDSFATEGVLEHGANGLYWGMDNAINVAEHTWNVQFEDGKFHTVPTPNRGQWGITQDNAGRIYRNVNTDPLFTDYIAARYYARNPDLQRTRGLYESLAKQEDSFIWPVHPTLGVNRGYRPEVSRPDGSSSYYQGVSSPLIYRGDALPKDVQNMAFVTDSPTNLVHLLRLKDDGTGNLSAGDYYKKGEFLASSDERFRPVALTPGWDGSFLIVDMYRGVSQDGPIQTDYLRNYVIKRKLYETTGLGRIWRVVYDTMPEARKAPAMLEETPAQLVEHLSDANGWWRDTAQQLLVQRNDKSVVPALKKLALTSPDARVRLQAMWTLDGMNSADPQIVTQALGDKSADVRAAGLRLSEHWLAQPAMQAAVLKLMDDPNWQVRRQLAASLGEMPADQRAKPILAMLTKYGNDQITVDAAISGLNGQEFDVLQLLLATPQPSDDAVAMLAGATGKNREVSTTQNILAIAVDKKQPEPVRLAILKGMAIGLSGTGGRRGGGGVAGNRAGGGIPGGGGRRGGAVRPLQLPAKPSALLAVSAGPGALADTSKQVLNLLGWPGKPLPPPVPPRTPEEDSLFAAGQTIYTTTCQGCHQAQGQGQTHTAAPLSGSVLVNATPDIVVRILTNGKDGSTGEMAPIGKKMTDEQLAAVLTYIRSSFGNTASPVHPAEVNEYRSQYAYRTAPWKDAELKKAAARRGRGPAAAAP